MKEALRRFSRIKISGNGKEIFIKGKMLLGNYSKKKKNEVMKKQTVSVFRCH